MFCLLFIVAVTFAGCKVTAGVYVEKDWQTDFEMAKPDLRTKLKLEAERDFNGWDEVFALHPGDNPCR